MCLKPLKVQAVKTLLLFPLRFLLFDPVELLEW